MFDPVLSPRSGFFQGGAAAVSAPSGAGDEHAVRFAFGDGIRTEWTPGFVELERSLRLTVPRPSEPILELPCYALLGGVRVGAVELVAGVDLALFGIDGLDHGVAFSFLSPGAIGKATVVLGRVRASAQLSFEYLWRWFDRRDIEVQAFVLEVALASPAARRWGSHPVEVIP